MSDSNGVASGFKKGDRVKVEYEGIVEDVSAEYVGVVADGCGYHSAARKADVTLLERPVEPLAVGSIVRHVTGQVWRVDGAFRVTWFDTISGGMRSLETPTSLAKAVRDNPDDYTLIHDGSKA